MKNKARRNEYKSSQAFEGDLALMASNASLFNGSQHPIALGAVKLQTIASADIEVRRGDIENMECVIRMDGAVQI